ncbi:MAG: GAF domain-containing sensor histidine kinase [Caldilineaceae bacterium]|nr:GAF domain-containing sensor histidine kinase [Caldilineaceae bacterium]
MTINPSGLLSSILLGFVLVIYAYAVYVIVVTLGTFPFGKIPNNSLLPSSDQRLLNLIALLCLSLTFVPVSRWLQGHINDLIYAQHDNPYAIPAHVNQQLRGMQKPQLTLPSVVETIGTKLYLPYVALIVDNALDQSYVFGKKQAQVAVAQYPIRYLDQPLAMLLVSHRDANRPFTDSDDQVLQECAQQIGVALYVAELTAFLQTSREQIIIAREAERRRIRNDLHDSLAPNLSAFQLQLGAIRRHLTQNPSAAEQIIAELSTDIRQATAVIRQLVYDLRPPLLDELGLIEAIKNVRLAETAIQLEVIAPAPMPPLSAAVEVAIYRIVTEALHNVTKHTHATTCTIALTFDDHKTDSLILTISDNGQGIELNQLGGIGIQSMRERAAELGGTFTIYPTKPVGTRIEVRLPWRNENG